MIYKVFDIESNGLLDKADTIYCLAYTIYNNFDKIEEGVLTDITEIKKFFEEDSEHSTEDTECLIGHNIVRYDIPLVQKLLGVNIPKNVRVIDTLALSFYLYPENDRHGLESWGKKIGTKKLAIEDWQNLDVVEYIERCKGDVRINEKIFLKFFKYLFKLYNGDEASVFNICQYLTFKMDCLKDQESIGIPVDVELCKKSLEELESMLRHKRKLLSIAMPVEVGKLLKKRPRKMLKKDGSISKKGVAWLEYLEENSLPSDTMEVREDPNPGSSPQLKEWLFRLGWEPETFKVSKATGKDIPQVSLPFGGGICPSIKKLYDDHPILEELEGYYVIRHRIGLFKGFLEKMDDSGKVYSTAHRLTNTLRLGHSKPVANLPKPSKFYGKEIRGCLKVPDDSYLMLGSDISGLEDNTKQHYIYFYDPKYVEEMRVPGFDPHLDIGVLAGLVTQGEANRYKELDGKEDLKEEESKEFSIIGSKRGTSKVANFAMTYNAFPPKIAEIAGISLQEAQHLFDVYWERNKAIKQVADSCKVKTVNGQTWLKNPLSGFWIFLKEEKDKFSTLNQNTGVFVFDCWMRKVRKKLNSEGIKVCLQYHDELLVWFKKERKEFVREAIVSSMAEVDKDLNLNVEITVSTDFGSNYSECH